MEIRQYQDTDFAELQRIHARYYKEEFSLEDFFDKLMDLFVIEDMVDKTIVCAGGIRPILESVAITNKEHSVRKRRCALSMLLELSTHATTKHKFDQLHVFIQDDKWVEHLKKYGFRPTVGLPMVKVL